MCYIFTYCLCDYIASFANIDVFMCVSYSQSIISWFFSPFYWFIGHCLGDVRITYMYVLSLCVDEFNRPKSVAWQQLNNYDKIWDYSQQEIPILLFQSNFTLFNSVYKWYLGGIYLFMNNNTTICWSNIFIWFLTFFEHENIIDVELHSSLVFNLMLYDIEAILVDGN